MRLLPSEFEVIPRHLKFKFARQHNNAPDNSKIRYIKNRNVITKVIMIVLSLYIVLLKSILYLGPAIT